MLININQHLQTFAQSLETINNLSELQFPDVTLEADSICMIMINEVTPEKRDDYFYSRKDNAAYMKTVIPIFRNAGVKVDTIDDIINHGIYITTAVKQPKTGYTVDSAVIKEHLFILEEELNLFPNLQVIMLMGDVAKKAVNTIARMNTKKSIIPSESTYKIRGNEYYYQGIRVFPSYIMTGGNILIEKSKVEMITDDLRRALQIIEK